ncbi:kinase-like protein [Leucogyrophana mollusca]|uniref:Kinase-like protein n=1 Tax=Leucogyrophana mollusca TaxID=85980 RepID=A0ACB8BIZ5_9AGAM|nr:kinase-like protein [Leucogyrophana mollusca]
MPCKPDRRAVVAYKPRFLPEGPSFHLFFAIHTKRPQDYRSIIMLILQVFYDGKIGERIDNKASSSITRFFNPGLKHSRASVESTTDAKAVPSVRELRSIAKSFSATFKRSNLSVPTSECKEVGTVDWPSSASIQISPVGILPPTSFASEESVLINDVADAFHDPEVLDVRRTVYVLPMIKAFLTKERKVANLKSPIHSPKRGLRDICAVVVSPRWLTGSTLVNASPKSATAPTAVLIPARSLSLDDFIVHNLLGSGANGSVYHVEHRLTTKSLALKVVRKNPTDNLHSDILLSEQVAMKRSIGNINLLPLEASFHDTANFYLAMPYHPVGDMHTQIAKWDGIPLDIVRFYTAELIVALHGIHQRGIIHRDVKPGNILLDEVGHPFIADFGLAKVFPNEIPGEMSPYGGPGTAYGLSQIPYLTKRCCGTPHYMAPEMFDGVNYGFGVDFWALGVTMYEMLTGITPWHSYDLFTMASRVKTASLLFHDDVDKTAQDFLQKMLAKKPQDRMSYEQMLQHDFFKGVDWKKIVNRTIPPPYIPKADDNEAPKGEPLVLIRGGDCYDQLNDPLPQFNFVSPSLERTLSWKLKARSTFDLFHRYVRKTLSRRISVNRKHEMAISSPTTPAQRNRPPPMILHDEDVAADWRVDTDVLSSGSSSFIPFAREPRSSLTAASGTPSRCSPCSNVTPTKDLLKLPTFLRGLRRRPSSSKYSRTEPSPTPTLCTPATLVACSADVSLKVRGTLSAKGDVVKNWISQIWHPIPTVTSRVGEARKMLDLTA